ncbi:PaaX family transcriptional regulator [Nitriliruptor alkaliphilus]|uniref:PaaX family transcriptional regulator n=1 Tax=Nitriliruptor alkaliphilus TaxID=427918 RepID=UPI001B8054BC|nr:PaaX family transcriptional regulator C-terminal domain-containing protein [Nitriliruptor alkaliphilus]
MEQSPSLVVRPQALLLTLAAEFLLDQPRPLSTTGFVEALTRAGVGEHAARSTLTRMCRRGLLERHRADQKVYLSLTSRTEQLLRDGEERVWRQGAVNRAWSGEWTVLSFSLPESRRAERHQLRKRLTWEGFGLLHNGLWITPSNADVPRLLSGLALDDEVEAFQATPVAPSHVQALVEDAWDLEALAAGYAAFLTRWGGAEPPPEIDDDLARFLLLLTEWLLLVRIDPHLPVQLLPPDWPAVPAEQLVNQLRAAYEPAARASFAAFADLRPAPAAG